MDKENSQASISMTIDQGNLYESYTSNVSKGSSNDKKKTIKAKQFDYTFKIVMIGDSGVGKSCFLLRFADDKFNENFYTTIGVDFRFKNIMIDDKSVKLQIWDTAGQERFKTITSAYYRGADGIIIVYDITDRSSFAHIKDWMDDVTKYTDNNPFKIVLGNKCDLNSNRQVTEDDIKGFYDTTGIEVVEVSAKMSIKVNDIMTVITKKLIEKGHKSQNDAKTTGISINDDNKLKQNGTSSCC